MSKVSSQAVRIMPGAKKAKLSAAQTRFNRLRRQIDAERANIQAWQEMLPLHAKKYREELAPLYAVFQQGQKRLMFLLDDAAQNKRLGKRDQERLRQMIFDFAADFLQHDPDDVEVRQIHDRYAEISFDHLRELQNRAMADLAGHLMGVNIDENVDFRSVEEVIRALDDEMEQKIESYEKILQEEKADRAEPRKKSAAETKREREELEASQSLRDVYRKLVSALHPDRETDADERGRKTMLMQELNAAYDARDLLTMLDLQLRIEQIDQAFINDISADRLKHYNRVLTEQLEELRHESMMIEMSFMRDFNLDPNQPLTPEAAMIGMEQSLAILKDDIESQNQELLAWRDIKVLKAALKDYEMAQKCSYLFNIEGFDDEWN